MPEDIILTEANESVKSLKPLNYHYYASVSDNIRKNTNKLTRLCQDQSLVDCYDLLSVIDAQLSELELYFNE